MNAATFRLATTALLMLASLPTLAQCQLQAQWLPGCACAAGPLVEFEPLLHAFGAVGPPLGQVGAPLVVGLVVLQAELGLHALQHVGGAVAHAGQAQAELPLGRWRCAGRLGGGCALGGRAEHAHGAIGLKA